MTIRGANTWRVWLGLILGLVLLAHLRFLVLDPRLPWDANLAYDQLPLVYAALMEPGGAGLSHLARLVFSETTGAYDLVLALPMALGAPRAAVLEAFGLLWTFAALGCSAWVARRLFGGRAAVLATALLASGWSVVVTGRTPWIHVPELALVLLTLCALVVDPSLKRWRSVALVAVAGAAAMSLRPSAVPWVGSLVPLLVVGVLRGQPRGAASARLAVVGAVWLVGLCPVVVELAPYLQGKLDRRVDYGHVVQLRVLLRQVNMAVGLLPALLGLAGLAALALRRRPEDAPAHRGPVLVLLSWLVLGPVLVLMFRAGLDNFPATVVALASLAGAGLARLPRPVWVVAGAVFALQWGMQWLPEPQQRPPSPLLRELMTAQPGLAYRVDTRLDPAVVLGLLDASCPAETRRRCVVFVDHGLFNPSPEEPGRLELFLADRGGVEVHPVYVHGVERMARKAQAFASYSCAALEGQWDARRPEWRGLSERVQRATNMVPVWQRDLGQGCGYTWSTPDGVVLRRTLLPD